MDDVGIPDGKEAADRASDPVGDEQVVAGVSPDVMFVTSCARTETIITERGIKLSRRVILDDFLYYLEDLGPISDNDITRTRLSYPIKLEHQKKTRR
jgi:hypothetical protein